MSEIEEDKSGRIEILYGFRVERPDWQCRIIEPPPLKWYEWLWYGFLDLLWTVIVPALMFAIGWTLLTVGLPR